MNTSESPAMRQRPATRGLSIGAGEDGYTGADRITVSGWAPSAIVLAGSFASRVGGSGALVGVGEEGALGAGAAVAIARDVASRNPAPVTPVIVSHRPPRFMHSG